MSKKTYKFPPGIQNTVFINIKCNPSSIILMVVKHATCAQLKLSCYISRLLFVGTTDEIEITKSLGQEICFVLTYC